MARMKEFSDGPQVRARDDGLTEAQLANMRAIYEDPTAYAEWRIRMGLSRAPEIRPSAVMRQRIAAMASDLAKQLQASNYKRPRDSWERAPARKLTPEEIMQLYSANPVNLSAAALETLKPKESEDA